MRYPMLSEMQTSRDWLEVFLGYNHNTRIGNGEFYNMKNLTGDEYPVLAPRKPRGVYLAEGGNVTGLIAKDSLCYVKGSKFYINQYGIEMGLNNSPKQLISMGAHVIIMPDKKYINTQSDNGVFDYGDIESHFTQQGPITFTMCQRDGGAYDNDSLKIQATAPTIVEGETPPIWIDTSSTPHTMKQYSTSSQSWVTITTTYVRIGGHGIAKGLNAGDTVVISGVIDSDKNLTTLNGSFNIISCNHDNTDQSKDFIVITGIIGEAKTQELGDTLITINRNMPNMDFIVEANNRLWGCKYGVIDNADGTKSVVNEIYACKLGDFKNWYCYQGIASDSYAVTVGSDGKFTGAITYLGYPIFFKENCAHKIYGNYPSNYQVQTTVLRGVQEGCHKSLVIVNETLYYKARSGIVAYTGSLPTEISSALGDVPYKNAVAGHLGNKYYVSMEDNDGFHHMFVYDTKKGLWHKEDEVRVFDFCNCRGDLYFVNYNEDQIHTINGTGTLDTRLIEWEAETGYLGTDTPDKKYISRLDIRMQLAVGSNVTFYAEYDSSGDWEYLFSMVGKNLQSFSVPVRPKRCDHLRLKIVGEGDAKIFSICKTIEWGSNR
jgi:hypothetical protein